MGMDRRFMICPDGKIAVGEQPGVSCVMGYISRLSDGTFRAERLDGIPLSDHRFESENGAAIFIDGLRQ